MRVSQREKESLSQLGTAKPEFFPAKQLQGATQEPSSTHELSSRHPIPALSVTSTSSEVSQGAVNPRKTALEQELAQARIELDRLEAEAYLANPHLKTYENYRNEGQNWADQDPSARAARQFLNNFQQTNQAGLKHSSALLGELENRLLPFCIVKLHANDPSFHPLLSGTFKYYVSSYMGFLKVPAGQRLPESLDEFIAFVKETTAIQMEIIERLRLQIGMSPEILEGVERGETGRLLTGLVDFYLATKTPKELEDARKAVRRAEILFGREQANETSFSR
jgi:hypothetical protein